jgi:PilZ domain
MNATYEASDERRRSPRLRTFLSATLREQGRASTWSCMVRNMSGDGARLEIADSTWVPEQFEFDVANKDLRRLASVVWREQGQLGIRFKVDGMAKELRANQELDNLRRKHELLRQRVTELTG